MRYGQRDSFLEIPIHKNASHNAYLFKLHLILGNKLSKNEL